MSLLALPQPCTQTPVNAAPSNTMYQIPHNRLCPHACRSTSCRPAYETLVDEAARRHYDQTGGTNFHQGGGGGGDGGGPPPEPFDYEAFFKKFDKVGRTLCAFH